MYVEASGGPSIEPTWCRKISRTTISLIDVVSPERQFRQRRNEQPKRARQWLGGRSLWRERWQCCTRCLRMSTSTCVCCSRSGSSRCRCGGGRNRLCIRIDGLCVLLLGLLRGKIYYHSQNINSHFWLNRTIFLENGLKCVNRATYKMVPAILFACEMNNTLCNFLQQIFWREPIKCRVEWMAVSDWFSPTAKVT